MAATMVPAIVPPPIASNARVAPVSASAPTRLLRKVGEVLSRTCWAPDLWRISACAWLGRTSPSGIRSLRQTRLSICPRFEAAAVCTRACLQSPDCEEGGNEIEEAGKTSIGFFVAGCDASECLETAEEVLDQMAPFVHFGIVGDARGAVGLGWDDRGSSTFIQVGAQPVVVKGLVADERLKIEIGDQRLDTDAVVTLARQKEEANEIAEGIDQGHDFGGQAATRAADGLILSPPLAPVPCWWTRTSVPSMRTYSKSGSSQRALKIRSQTPF